MSSPWCAPALRGSNMYARVWKRIFDITLSFLALVVLLPVLVIVVISTVIVFAVAGKVTQWLRRKGGSHD